MHAFIKGASQLNLEEEMQAEGALHLFKFMLNASLNEWKIEYCKQPIHYQINGNISQLNMDYLLLLCNFFPSLTAENLLLQDIP